MASGAANSMLVFCLGLATVHGRMGAGAWIDPHHYKGPDSFAGLRFISEHPMHVLNVVGSDDGLTWFTVHGGCSGPSMQTLTFDFSSKGARTHPSCAFPLLVRQPPYPIATPTTAATPDAN